MEARKCNYCGGAIPSGKRADSKYCSNSCKANYWEASKGKQPEPVKAVPVAAKPNVAGQPLEGIRGVIDNQPKIAVTAVKETSITPVNEQVTATTERTETKAYKDALAELNLAEGYYTRARQMKAGCEKNLRDWKAEIEKLRALQKLKPINIDAFAVLDHSGYIDSRAASIQEQLREARQKVDENNGHMTTIEAMLSAAKRKYDEAQQKLQSIPRYEVVKQKPLVPLTGLIKAEPEPAKTPLILPEEAVTESTAIIPSSSKLISSQELRGMNYKCLNFQGRWKDFFGLPAVVFHLAVHGKPGEGKSTFCIQFADYLAQSFGNVVYVSGEEGFSKTLKDKVVNNKINNPHLYFADISSYEEIKQEIEDNKFHFIFLDSLDTLGIDTARLRDLRAHYPQSTFVTISQSTKDGKMRGSQEIIHDTDIAVKVEDGIAVTTKNRYQARGTEFSVFPSLEKHKIQFEKPTSTKLGDPKNII